MLTPAPAACDGQTLTKPPCSGLQCHLVHVALSDRSCRAIPWDQLAPHLASQHCRDTRPKTCPSTSPSEHLTTGGSGASCLPRVLLSGHCIGIHWSDPHFSPSASPEGTSSQQQAPAQHAAQGNGNLRWIPDQAGSVPGHCHDDRRRSSLACSGTVGERPSIFAPVCPSAVECIYTATMPSICHASAHQRQHVKGSERQRLHTGQKVAS